MSVHHTLMWKTYTPGPRGWYTLTRGENRVKRKNREKPCVKLHHLNHLLLLLLLLIHTFSVLSLQLKKLRWHNKSALDLSNANPACGHKEVRRSTGHIMVTTRYSDQQGSKSRQKVMRLYKQWHRPISKRFIKPPYSISRAISIDSECCRLPTTSVLSKKPETNQFWSTSPSFSRPHILYRNKENWNTEVHGGGGLELVKPAREPASSRPKPCAFLKKPHESCPFAAPCGPRRKKNDRGQRSAFPSETSRFKPVILAHRGSALPWLVNDRAALRLRRIWCVPTR